MLVCVVFLFANISALGETDRITASPSGHYVQYQVNTLALIGDSGTQCVTQDANLDYRQWIDDCWMRAIRVVHVWSFAPLRQHQDGSKIEERYGYVYPGLTPWARKKDGPLAADQLPQWDLRAFDEGPDGDTTHYWSRLRDLCHYARRKGILVGITVFTGWAKHDEDWVYHPLNKRNGGHLEKVRDAVQIESPDREIVGEAWSDTWPDARKTQWVWERLAKKYIDDLNPMRNVFFVFLDEHSYDEGNMGDHFLRFFKQRGAVWADWSKRQQDVDLVYSDTYSKTDKNKLAIAGFNATPARPFLLLEGEPYLGPDVRLSMWSFLLGGGHYTFHGDFGQETPRTGIMGYDPKVPGGDKGMAKRDWLGHASRFFNEHVRALDKLAPHNELLHGDGYCLANPGQEYVVYLKRGPVAPVALELGSTPTGNLLCIFYNPRDGASRTTHMNEQRQFVKPDSEDWVLHVIAQ